jgi:signal transduction histidine kinase
VTRTRAKHLRRVQVRITAVAIGAVIVVLVVTAVGVVRFVEREQRSRLDDQLVSTVEFVEASRAEGIELPSEAPPGALAQLLDGEGAVVYASPSLEASPALVDRDDLGTTEPRLFTVDGGALGELRAVVAPFEGRWLVLGESTKAVTDATESLVRVFSLALPLLVVLLGALIWLVVGRALRPVEAAMERERRLVADASHELRSPLAGMRALLETGTDDTAAALAALDRLDKVADDLLLLAREDRVVDRPPSRPVDLDDLVLDQVQHRPDNGVRIDTSEVSSGQVLGHESDLVRLTENLLTNAVRHARAEVAVSVTEHDGWVELTVDDDGAGIAPGDRDRVFERFTRLDDARSRDDGGAGLGLAIAAAVTDAHRGEITVADSPLGGARFRVRLPASVG